jgi:predicted Zn finger-like uncharacterized protein
MQFACDSCKAQLQIADEKVRGRRLIVRCKRCGAKIAVADPSFERSPPRVVEPSAAGPPVSDTDPTRAMESEGLEKALQRLATGGESANGSPPTQRFAAPSPPVPVNPAVWFAMLQGKQTGPLTRAELEERANEGELGPRTYVWCEGMDSWQRAKDVLELVEMFPTLPAKEEARPAPPRPTPPVVPLAPTSESAARNHRRAPSIIFFVALSASAAAGAALWIVLGSSPRKSEAAPPPAAIGLTADQVRRKLDEHQPALQDCIDDALRRDPDLRLEKIHVATTIAPSGQVTAARIDRQSVDESPLGACLKRATQQIVFPRFTGAAFDVDIPISVKGKE